MKNLIERQNPVEPEFTEDERNRLVQHLHEMYDKLLSEEQQE